MDEYDDDFTAMMGAEAVQILLSEVDIEKTIQEIREELDTSASETKIKKLQKRLKLMEAFKDSGQKPEWDDNERVASTATRSKTISSS